jgi:hypothetical protein
MTQRVLWYPRKHRDLRSPLLRQLTNLQRWDLVTVWSEMTDAGDTYYVITPQNRPLTASQRDKLRRFQHWFNDHNYLI